MKPLSIVGAGVVSSVGLDWPSSAAALRCGLDGFIETGFLDEGGAPIIASPVPDLDDARGLEKLLRMASTVVAECLKQAVPTKSEQIPLLLCIAEKDRPGRWDNLDEDALEWLGSGLGKKFHPESGVVAQGRVSIAHALKRASTLIHEKQVPFCLIVGTDGFLTSETLRAYEKRHRLKTTVNSNGFIPGEGAAGVLVGPPGKSVVPRLECVGIGVAAEKATIESEEPRRADGLLEAMRAALKDGGCTFDDVDYRITDLNGEQYPFKEAALAIGRGVRKVKPEFELWHPAEGVGEIGSAAGPCTLAVALAAARKKYAPGPGVLCHLAGDDGTRVAMVLRWREGGDV
jgi:3-oxoacyl-[acyl-carrier-protein] synthase I